MEFKTKFNVGDKAWIMNNNQPIQITIDSIVVHYFGRCLDIRYNNDTSYLYKGYSEEKIFESKELLLKSL